VKKLTKMHWHDYNNTVPLLNIAKSQNTSSGIQLLKFQNLALFRLPTSQPTEQPAVRSGSTSAIDPDFSYKKGYCIYIVYDCYYK